MKTRPSKVDLDILQDLEWIEFYRENPVIAAEDLLIRNGRPLKLPPHQRIILNDLWKGTPFVMLILTRGGGKTAIIAVYLVLRGLLYPHERLGIISGNFRQAKKCFEEITRFYNESPIMQASSKQPPTRGNDQHGWYVKNESFVKALPIGDGNAVRGERFFKMFLDEFPQVDEKVFKTVLVPMLATRKDPTAPMTADEEGNQLILASSATWQFSWAYPLYLEYKRLQASGDKSYSVHEFDCDDVGEFLDPKIVEYSRLHSPREIFLMEYKLLWPRDSYGFFPASLLSTIKKKHCLTEAKGKDGCQYVLGVDPARESDNFAVCVIRLSKNGNRVVSVNGRKGLTFPEMAGEIRRLCREFNIVRIALDYGGGGTSVRDLIAEESVWENEKGELIEEDPILSIDPKDSPDRYGKRILDLVYFSPKEIYEMNMNLKSDMEHGRLIMPLEPIKGDEESELIFEEMKSMEKEIVSIITKTTSTGVIQFDTPSKRMQKDRYTALMLANKAARDFNSLEEKEEDSFSSLAWGIFT